MSQLMTFNNAEFGTVRTVEIDGQPWLVGKDVAKALGYERTYKAIQDNVDKEDIDEVPVKDPIGRMQKTKVINESGLYSLVLSSKLPRAKIFKRWVTSEVIPAIRKNGGYIAGQEQMTPQELMASALLMAQKTLEERESRIQALEQKVEEDKPKVLFSDAVSASRGTILIRDLAKLLTQNGVPNMGQNKLMAWMKENGYLCKTGERNITPTQRAANMGLFEVVENCRFTGHGTITSLYSKVTPKGQQYFLNKFLQNPSLLPAKNRV